ncbi:MAG: MFS transporter [Deltaproteobacteria bacterium]|nr:MFS transporter [Deltaproteobacteria bacterium]
MAVRAIFAASFLMWAVGNGIMPLLPVRAGLLGLGNEQIGIFLAGAFASLLAGTLLVGRFFDRIRNPSVLVLVCGPAGALAFLLMALSTTATWFIAGTFVAWGCTGVLIATLNASAGLRFPADRRGKLFGALSSTIPAGALVGGFAAGAIVDAFSFRTMFICAAVVAALASAVLWRPVHGVSPSGGRKERAPSHGLPRSWTFWCFILATVVAAATGFAARIGTPLVMASMNMSNFTISGTVAAGGLLALPLAPLVGRLSDRVGRLGPLVACTVALSAGLLLIPFCEAGWQFWISGILVSAFFYIGFGLGLALMSDLVDEKHMGLGVGIFQGAQWSGGISGILLTGMTLTPETTTQVFGINGIVALASISLLLLAAVLGRRKTPPTRERTTVVEWQSRMTRTSLPP